MLDFLQFDEIIQVCCKTNTFRAGTLESKSQCSREWPPLPGTFFTPFVCACATQHATKMTSTNPFAAVATILEVPLDDPVPSHLLLKLKRKPERKRKVRFTDDTIDNEDLCRKKSKNCCVFHRSQAPPDDDDDGGDDDTPGDAHPEGSGASPAADGGSSSSSSSEADSAT